MANVFDQISANAEPLARNMREDNRTRNTRNTQSNSEVFPSQNPSNEPVTRVTREVNRDRNTRNTQSESRNTRNTRNTPNPARRHFTIRLEEEVIREIESVAAERGEQAATVARRVFHDWMHFRRLNPRDLQHE